MEHFRSCFHKRGEIFGAIIKIIPDEKVEFIRHVAGFGKTKKEILSLL
jgi:hypothetical protein